MKSKVLLLSTLLCAIFCAAIAPCANAEFLCQAEKNAYIAAANVFNADPSPANANALALAAANYESCKAIVSQPAAKTH